MGKNGAGLDKPLNTAIPAAETLSYPLPQVEPVRVERAVPAPFVGRCIYDRANLTQQLDSA